MPAIQSSKIKIEYYIFYKENKESKPRYGKTDFTYQVSQLSQLDIKGRRFRALLCTLTCHFPNLRGISHTKYFHRSVTVDHSRATHHQIGGIRSFFIKIRLYRCFINYRLSGQVRFIHL